MREHLQDWYSRWLDEHKETTLIYVSRNAFGDACLEQVHFIRDTLAHQAFRDIPNEQLPRDDSGKRVSLAFVIGEHTSKSVRLPVFSIERPDLGLQFVLRYNFHDWNISVVSALPVDVDLGGFSVDGSYRCFFQGFPDEFRSGPYADSQCRFSICIPDDYQLFTFVWLVMRWRLRARAEVRR